MVLHSRFKQIKNLPIHNISSAWNRRRRRRMVHVVRLNTLQGLVVM